MLPVGPGLIALIAPSHFKENISKAQPQIFSYFFKFIYFLKSQNVSTL